MREQHRLVVFRAGVVNHRNGRSSPGIAHETVRHNGDGIGAYLLQFFQGSPRQSGAVTIEDPVTFVRKGETAQIRAGIRSGSDIVRAVVFGQPLLPSAFQLTDLGSIGQLPIGILVDEGITPFRYQKVHQQTTGKTGEQGGAGFFQLVIIQ